MKKHYDACACSYKARDRKSLLPIREQRQHCSNPNYNSPDYTGDMFMEDRKRNYCRFWTPGNERKVS